LVRRAASCGANDHTECVRSQNQVLVPGVLEWQPHINPKDRLKMLNIEFNEATIGYR
jgi:hypothetical protein